MGELAPGPLRSLGKAMARFAFSSDGACPLACSVSPIPPEMTEMYQARPWPPSVAIEQAPFWCQKAAFAANR
jgi:hypothetical protein